MSDGGDVLRFVLSFVFVIALMWAVARMMRKQVTGRSTGALEVIARQGIARGSAVAVVRVGDRALVVGVTEQRVSLLGEADSALVEELRTRPAAAETGSKQGRRRRRADIPSQRRRETAPDAVTALHGSILSVSTWRQAVDVMRERTVRNG